MPVAELDNIIRTELDLIQEWKPEKKTLLIQSRWIGDNLIPAHSFGYTAVEAAEYYNWYYRRTLYECRFIQYVEDANADKNQIPIGSVEFALRWFKQMGVTDIQPLNIPKELWGLCRREIKYVHYLNELAGEWMVKSGTEIKAACNGKMNLPQNATQNTPGFFFATRWRDDIVSEWRVFIKRGKVVGVKCYSGDEWVMPDRPYIDRAVASYDKQCYALDVMVYENGVTDIVELHDFFSCGLYGFENYTDVLFMWSWAVQDILKRGRQVRRL